MSTPEIEDRGLGIWFKDGVWNIIASVDEANLAGVQQFEGRHPQEVEIYRSGARAMAAATARAFGIRYVSPDAPPPNTEEAVDRGGDDQGPPWEAKWTVTEPRKLSGPRKP